MEVGEIPADWRSDQLGKIAIISVGGTPSRSIPGFWSGRVPWVTTSEIDFGTITSTQQNISETGLENSAAKLLQPGTLLVALYGQGKTRGKVAVLGIEAATNQACAAISVRPEFDSSFVFHFLANSYSFIRSLSNIGNQENLSSDLVRSIPVTLPPTREEQVAIADALSDVDALIESLQQLIAKKRRVKQGAMQELLTGRRRLPGFEVEPGFKSSEVGPIPVDWEAGSVREVGQVVTGKALDKKGPGELRQYLRTVNVMDGRIDTSDVLKMPMTDSEFEHFSVAIGDLLLNEGQDISLVGRCSMYRGELGIPCAMQNQLLRVRVFDRHSSSFFEKKFRRCQATGAFARIATQTTSVAHLGMSRFMELQLAWPANRSEQEAIAKLLDSMEEEIFSIDVQIQKTQKLKEGMMQELLTGRIRLPPFGNSNPGPSTLEAATDTLS